MMRKREIFPLADLDKLRSKIKLRDPDTQKRIEGVIERIYEYGNLRYLRRVSSDYEKLLDDLDATFPNFHGVVESLRDHCALVRLDGGEFAFPPALLVGEPGVGKTEFLHSLARLFDIDIHFCDFATAQTEAVLTGTDAHWGNSHEGIVFEALVFSDIANPIIVIDELDKAMNRYGGSPVAALYRLLEPTTAKNFTDASIRELRIDARHIVWLATANSTCGIDPPILSRFTTFHVDPPSPEQVAAISRNIYKRLIVSNPWGRHFGTQLDDDVVDVLAGHTPRQIRKVLMRALGGAAREGRKVLEVRDVASRFSNAAHARRKVGFV